jgi:transcriptional regulator of heat shock response
MALYWFTMNEMNERASHILEALIQGFIATGEPVSSGWLYDHYDFGIKPAMIRLELDALEGGGYLTQPHHSAGRVPTDTGYEFFARHALGTVPESRETALRELLEERAWPDLLTRLTNELGLLSVVADLARDAVYKAGLEALVESLDWQDREELRSVIRDFEEMDERVPRAAEKLGPGPHVFIGRKSPVTKSENLSVVGGNYRTGNVIVSIFAVGPKRMDYRKTIRLFKSL